MLNHNRGLTITRWPENSARDNVARAFQRREIRRMNSWTLLNIPVIAKNECYD